MIGGKRRTLLETAKMLVRSIQIVNISHTSDQNILHPNIPFLINGKPYNLHTKKNQLEKYKKKKKKEKLKIKSNEITPDVKFSSNGKPTGVYNLTESQPDRETHLTSADLKSKNTIITLQGKFDSVKFFSCKFNC